MCVLSIVKIIKLLFLSFNFSAHLVALKYCGKNVSMLTALLSFMIVTELSILNLPMTSLKHCSYMSIYLMIVLKILMIICSILVSCCKL